MELLDYEKKHIDFLQENAQECTLFLKKNGAFPIEKPCTVALYGNGARNTVKGGTGSGDVASRFFVNIEQSLKDDGFTILTTDWMDRYDAIKKAGWPAFVKEAKKAAKKDGYMAAVYTMGYFEREPEYDLPLTADGDIAVYVLSRNSGEGNDRRLLPGDVYLSATEIRDIKYLNEHYEKFMLVLNVGGVIDLTPVLAVENILYISQLGVVTGTILGKILLGKANPSGKLASTWAKPEDYSTYHNFGDLHDVNYEEGIYVGYRYFDTMEKPVTFPFGYGLSYSDYDVRFVDASILGSMISVRALVRNVTPLPENSGDTRSALPGKEVVQLYLSAPCGKLDKPRRELGAFAKTRELAPGEEETLTLTFDLRNHASYDEETARYLLEKGPYVLSLGTSAQDNTAVAYVSVDEDITVLQCGNKMGNPGFTDLKSEARTLSVSGLPELKLNIASIETKTAVYKKQTACDPDLQNLSDRELMLLTLGHHGTGFAAIVGSSCAHVIGGAGETCLSVPGIRESLTMADGPAGLRLKTVYGIDKKGVYDISMDPLMEKMMDFLPKASGLFMKPPKNRHGEVHYQYTTAIPIGTAIAQSFNLDFARALGSLVAEEMERFNVDLWLAPALNIHRNILCGRNFEYFSEDPFVSGAFAAAITQGVEAHPGRGVTVKHFLGNNQELNRNNGNSHISERALREIYLRGFERCIKEADPKALMTSYNLVSGTHTSESYELLNDILRCEIGYKGLIMTDWIATGRSFCRKHIYPAPCASKNILAGNDLTMSGAPADEKDILKALKKGTLTRDDLLNSASRIVAAIKKQKGGK